MMQMIACQTHLCSQNQCSPVCIELTASSLTNPTVSSAPSLSLPTPAVMDIHAEFLSAQRAETVDPPMLPLNTDSMGIENLFTWGTPATRVGWVHCTQDFVMLSECTCRVAVLQDEISAGCDVIRCKKTGCETQWVSLTHSHGKHGLTHDLPSSMHRAWVCNQQLDLWSLWVDHWGKHCWAWEQVHVLLVFQGLVHRTVDWTGPNRGPCFSSVHFSENLSNRNHGLVNG